MRFRYPAFWDALIDTALLGLSEPRSRFNHYPRKIEKPKSTKAKRPKAKAAKTARKITRQRRK